MRRFRYIFGLVVLLAAGLPAFAASNSADVAHLHVQLVFPDQNLYPGRRRMRAFISSSSRAGMCTGRMRATPASRRIFNGLCPRASRASSDAVSRAPTVAAGPADGFRLRERGSFPVHAQVAGPAKPGPAVLHAKVDWLVCREVCIPGKAELDQNVNVISGTPVVNLISPTDQQLLDRLANSAPAIAAQRPTPPSSSPRRPASVSPSPPASAKRKPNSSLKTRTSSTILRRKPSRPRQRPRSSTSKRTRISPRTRAVERRARARRRQELRDRCDARNRRCSAAPPPARSPSARSPAPRSSLFSAGCCST